MEGLVEGFSLSCFVKEQKFSQIGQWIRVKEFPVAMLCRVSWFVFLNS